MKPDILLDHALGQLEGPDREAAERELAANPALAANSDRLVTALRRVLDDGDPGWFEPPAGLASRTVALVADRGARHTILDFVPARVPFRWADVAVAAGVLLAGLLTLVPAMNAARSKTNQMGCAFNLQQLGASLASYANRYNHYPDVRASVTGAQVGHYAAALKDDHLLHDVRSLHCPCLDQCPEPATGRHIDYAYNPGYRHQPSDEPGPIRLTHPAVLPLLADQPAHDGQRILPGNSPNHGYRGQNVLFSDLHVEWFPTRQVRLDRDIFLNDQNQPEPGVGAHDAALVPAVFRIDTH